MTNRSANRKVKNEEKKGKSKNWSLPGHSSQCKCMLSNKRGKRIEWVGWKPTASVLWGLFFGRCCRPFQTEGAAAHSRLPSRLAVVCVCVFKPFREKLENGVNRRSVSLHHNGNSPPLHLLLRFASISSSSLFSSYFLLMLPLPWCHLVISLLPFVNLNYCHRELSAIRHMGKFSLGLDKLNCSVCVLVCECANVFVFTWVRHLSPDLSVSFPSLPLSLSLPSSFSLSTGFQNGWAKVSPPSPTQSESQILTSPCSPDSSKASLMAEAIDLALICSQTGFRASPGLNV